MMNTPIFRKQQRSSSKKVISVPVQFISSQSQTKPSISNDSAARKIQKLFRSLLVRKCVKKINSIRTEVIEIERRINDIETVNLIRNDPKERLRVNETLMSLLFKLDSIRGIDSGVRDLRKTVTKKAIALQEKVDSIAQSETIKEVENCDSVKVAPDQVTETVNEVVENCDSVKVASDQVTETVNEVVENCDYVKVAPDQVTEAVNEVVKNCDSVKVAPAQVTETVKEVVENCDSIKVAPDQVTETVKEVVENCDSVKVAPDHLTETVENCDSVKDVDGSMEKLRDDNEKMMKLMMRISERNEMQTRMINSLSRRVEQLEKGFMNDNKLRRKKKTKGGLRRRDRDDFYICY